MRMERRIEGLERLLRKPEPNPFEGLSIDELAAIGDMWDETSDGSRVSRWRHGLEVWLGLSERAQHAVAQVYPDHQDFWDIGRVEEEVAWLREVELLPPEEQERALAEAGWD